MTNLRVNVNYINGSKIKKIVALLLVGCSLFGSMTQGSETLSSCSPKNNLAGDRGVAQEKTGAGNERKGDERDDKNDNDGASDHNDHPDVVRLIEPKVVRRWEHVIAGVVASVIIDGVTIVMAKTCEGYKLGRVFS